MQLLSIVLFLNVKLLEAEGEVGKADEEIDNFVAKVKLSYYAAAQSSSRQESSQFLF
jgi:hypothetical protein